MDTISGKGIIFVLCIFTRWVTRTSCHPFTHGKLVKTRSDDPHSFWGARALAFGTYKRVWIFYQGMALERSNKFLELHCEVYTVIIRTIQDECHFLYIRSSTFSPKGRGSHTKIDPWFKIAASVVVLARTKNRYGLGIGHGYRSVAVVAV